MSIVSVLVMVFVVNSLYFFWEVNAHFICKLPKIKDLLIKKGCRFDTTSGVKEVQLMTTSLKTGREIPKRDPQRAADALEHAGYVCEYENTDRTFMRKNGKPYTEPHHLIPISKYRDFEYSVDVMENIVSLCSHCHNLLHYGCWEEKEPVLKKLFIERQAALENCGLDISFERLTEYYKIVKG